MPKQIIPISESIFFRFLFVFTLLLVSCYSSAQQIKYLSEKEYTFKKHHRTIGQFDMLSERTNITATFQKSEHEPVVRASGCGGFVEDIGPAYAMTWNSDDGSAPHITLPFTFCFFSDQYTDVYMNNNGNVSFLQSNSTFTPSAFPSNIHRIIAGFWADFDFATSGTMHLRMTSSAAIFTWKNCGYYEKKNDKINTLQIVITDGNDPLVEGGNVAIHYGDMNWTCGDATGTNGFGGTPACIGANRGNGVDYFQMGFFDHVGSSYDGPDGAADGIDWLDNKSFYFDFCNVVNGNIAPIPLTNANCTPTKLCSIGDTLKLNFPFVAPEKNQTTTVTYSAPTLHNVQVLSSTTGFQGELSLQILGQGQTPGIHEIVITGTDNATPPASTLVRYKIEILDGNQIIATKPKLEFKINCPPVLFKTSDDSFDSYLWSTNSTTNSTTITTTYNDHVSVVVNRLGCKIKLDTAIYIPPIPRFHFQEDLFYCFGEHYKHIHLLDSHILKTINWNTTEFGTNNLYFNAKLSKGNHTIQITDSSGQCMNDTTITIIQFEKLLLKNPTYTCEKEFKMSENQGGSSIGHWNPTPFIADENLTQLNPKVTLPNFGPYQLTYTDDYCHEEQTISLYYSDYPRFNLRIDDIICKKQTIKVQYKDSIQMNWINWNNNQPLHSPYFTANLHPGNHALKLENKYGCQKDTTLIIKGKPSPVLIAETTQCGNTTDFSKSTGLAPGTWSVFSTIGHVDLTNNKTPQASAAISHYGDYIYVYEDSLCGETDTLKITYLPHPEIVIAPEAICDGINQFAIATDKYPSYTTSIEWNTGSHDYQAEANIPGTYSITIQNQCGTAFSEVLIADQGCSLTVPNVFSPNGDGTNDEFFINNAGSDYQSFEFSIINRWGNIVATFDKPDFKWTGTDNNNQKLPEGVYYYHLRVMNNHTTHKKEGVITLKM